MQRVVGIRGQIRHLAPAAPHRHTCTPLRSALPQARDANKALPRHELAEKLTNLLTDVSSTTRRATVRPLRVTHVSGAKLRHGGGGCVGAGGGAQSAVLCARVSPPLLPANWRPATRLHAQILAQIEALGLGDWD
jgi:hypothetical protein